MKKFTKYFIVTAIICMAALSVHARTTVINAKAVKGDLTEYLRYIGFYVNHSVCLPDI